MIFSEQGRSKRKSLRRSRMRRFARSGVAILSGFVMLSLAALSLVMANLSGQYDATQEFAATHSQPQQQPVADNQEREELILDQTLAKLNTLQTASVEQEQYDTCDSEVDYSLAASEHEPEQLIAGEEIDQTPAMEPGEEIVAQIPADEPVFGYGPSSPSAPSVGPFGPAYPGLQPNRKFPAGPSFPRVAGSPHTPKSGPSSYGPTPFYSSGGGGGGSPGKPSAPYVNTNGPSGNNPPNSGGKPSDPIVAGPVDLPSELDGPLIGDASDPTDGWFSPGHSPGIATVAGDFNLDGQTLLFEILGTEPGSGYDQLQVGGIANLNEGNVVFAFINGYVPSESDLYDLILGQEILVDLENVNFYYGLFDPANDPDYNLHAPHNLSLYTALDYTDANPEDDVKLYEVGNGSATNNNGILEFDQLMRISYKDQGGVKTSGPDKEFDPIQIPRPGIVNNDDQVPPSQVNVPEPAPLLLLAFGLVLLRRFGKSKAA